MSNDLEQQIKANINLYAVLPNLEELVRLDADSAEKSKKWRIVIQFSVKNGPQAYVAFDRGRCTVGRGAHEHPTVKLYFKSPEHLNLMFEGKANPIPLKGFLRLGFLTRKFARLTERLEYFLKPEDGRLDDPDYVRVNTPLTLYTAFYCVAELAQLDPISRHLAAQMGTGRLQVEVLPDGPVVHLELGDGTMRVAKGKAEHPMAKMIFRNLQVASDLLNDRLDGFRAVAQGDVAIWGHVPMVENANLILERVRQYVD
ncbi:MAG TPA: SCP2 sterol-binding domain-containing protein [Candidatus Hydrogenedentes bacterium]|nr:SCP2 sterol-binding domain-containing protein [Candidatus Hydrogenedentota bacterium]HPG68070.1 SCP2 sterol-binding domain-containing protein [Candidatus Hydrogenedentota bacterium]